MDADVKRAAKAEKVLKAVEAWIAKHQPTCAESLYQVDSTFIAAPDLVEKCCKIVGYVKLKDLKD